MLKTAHKEYVRRANLVERMLYELDQCGMESEALETEYATLMDRARDIRQHIRRTQ